MQANTHDHCTTKHTLSITLHLFSTKNEKNTTRTHANKQNKHTATHAQAKTTKIDTSNQWSCKAKQGSTQHTSIKVHTEPFSTFYKNDHNINANYQTHSQSTKRHNKTKSITLHHFSMNKIENITTLTDTHTNNKQTHKQSTRLITITLHLFSMTTNECNTTQTDTLTK